MTKIQLDALLANADPGKRRFSWFPTQLDVPPYPGLIPIDIYDLLEPPPGRKDGLPLGYPSRTAAIVALKNAVAKYRSGERK